MREFLDNCLHQRGEHGRCEQVTEHTTPTRLLSIKRGRSAPYDAAIWIPDRHVQYAALSYCWGGDQVHKTTSARLASGNMNLDWYAMPKTIQDAIEATAELGLEYLWVDSLCIIQDDDTDKMREIAQMPETYNHALVTIVAARPKTANDGFLHEIAPTKATARMFKVAYRCADGIEGHVFLVRENEYISTEHIDTRAWTLQESYLSKRLLRYGTNQCSMVCQHSPLRPKIVDGWIKDTSNDTQQLLNNLLFPTTLAALTDQDVVQYKAHYHETFDEDIATPVEYETENGDLIDLWIQLVEDYTSRALTVASDRPLAISGLASRVAPLLQDGYKAGHWLQYMPMDLLWYVSEAREGSHVYQAPSWSWTSVKGPIVFNTRGRLMRSEQQSLKILDVDATAVDAMAPFGAVRSGQIRASGKLLKVSWTGDQLVAGRGIDQAPLFSAASEDAARQFFPDTLDVDFVHASNIEIPIRSEVQSSEGESCTTESELAKLFLLEVFSSDVADDLYPGGSIGLVLLEVQSAHEHQSFVRIGLFDFSETDQDPDFGPIIRNQGSAFDGCEFSEFVIE